MIDLVTGKPSLKRRRAKAAEAAGLALEEAIKERMPERTLLEILARTAYWLEWWRRLTPLLRRPRSREDSENGGVMRTTRIVIELSDDEAGTYLAKATRDDGQVALATVTPSIDPTAGS